jgi:hypothetical protein
LSGQLAGEGRGDGVTRGALVDSSMRIEPSRVSDSYCSPIEVGSELNGLQCFRDDQRLSAEVFHIRSRVGATHSAQQQASN